MQLLHPISVSMAARRGASRKPEWDTPVGAQTAESGPGARTSGVATFPAVSESGKVSKAVSRVSTASEAGLYIVLISVHGLIRGQDPELGRDADTGGQVLYVLDLARALSRHPEVARVDLMTRQVLSTNVAHEYGEHLERLTDKAWIVRVPFGPHRYLRKESLWPYLPQLVDGAILHFRQIGRLPDLVHGHYADAGLVAATLGELLDEPAVFTGHSLGKIKLRRLLEKGLSEETIEGRYNIARRIAAEEQSLEAADLIVASTEQEATEQYSLYDTETGSRTAVIPPGVDLGRFGPPRRGQKLGVQKEIDRFLAEPKKPLILAVQRPDERKNLGGLLRAYGEHEQLRDKANLALLIGAREEIGALGAAQRKVLTEMLMLIDRYDLYGKVAYPKNHSPEDVPEAYQLAARRRGVFVNPALTEPFGLTLIEAAASGLPVVATKDGGPQEIVRLCKNGLLVDPLDPDDIARGLLEVVDDPVAWRRRSRSGVRGASSHFSWDGHVRHYVAEAKKVRRKSPKRKGAGPRRLVTASGILVCDIDNTLTGDKKSVARLVDWLRSNRANMAFGVATGRRLEGALEALRKWRITRPDVLISAVGSEIHYGTEPTIEELGWRRTIDRDWDRRSIEHALDSLPGLRLQPDSEQSPLKLSYFVDAEVWPGVASIRRRLKTEGFGASVIYSGGRFLDLLPTRASKGKAVSYLARQWGLPLESVVAAGDSGNDVDMLRAAGRAIVVGNFAPELRTLRGRDHVYFAQANHAAGILEGLARFDIGSQAGDESARPAPEKGDSP
jgi:sucrose-phosphate synthase